MNRDAVVTIQGGGVFGLSLLGQLESVLKHGYNPLALAGTSAGAIIATLLWAGYTPNSIRASFAQRLKTNSGLLNLLAPFEPPPKPHLDFDRFVNLSRRATGSVKGLIEHSRKSRVNPRRWFGLLRYGSALARLSHQLTPHLTNRGFFRGDQLENMIEELLRSAPDAPEVKKGEPLCFRDYNNQIRRAPKAEKERFYRPLLVLTATNLSKGRLELINSAQERYQNIPVAKAVRASAGFPVFFRPCEIPGGPGCLVDGGVISNFPAWVFSDLLREELQNVSFLRHLAPKPWIRIGLRVDFDERDGSLPLDEPEEFFGALWSMLAGGTRNQLENILASRAPRSITIRQPVSKTGGPPNILALANLTEETLDSMVTKGEKFADAIIEGKGVPQLFNDACRAMIEKELRSLLDKVLKIMGVTQRDAHIRANVFLASEEKLVLTHQFNMDADPDKDLVFPDQQSGLSGFCYSTRRPHVCNLRHIARIRQDERFSSLFGMPTELQKLVRKDRTWLASVPVFDPYEMRTPSGSTGDFKHPYPVTAHYGLEPSWDGAVLGVLNVDGGWDYDCIGLPELPEEFAVDPRIEGVIALMQSAAARVGKLLTQEFPFEGGGDR